MSVLTTCESCLHPSNAIRATITCPFFLWGLLDGCVLVAQLSKRYCPQICMGYPVCLTTLCLDFYGADGGGDEKIVLLHILQNPSSQILAKLLAVLVTLVCCLPPPVMGIRQLPDQHKGVYSAGFIIVPLLFGMRWQRFFLNGLLLKGWGTTQLIAGKPLLVMIQLIAMLLLLFFFGRSLSPGGKQLNKQKIAGIQAVFS